MSVKSVVDRACANGDLEGYWATAETVASVASEWPGLKHVAQGEGGLGLRMATVYRCLHARHDAVILIGADSPQLECGQLLRAAQWLQSEQARLVMGRARDGGFWLFGGNRELPEHAWTRVDYSTPGTANDFVRAMDGQGEWQQLDVLQDIDTAADIEPVRVRLLALADATPEQARLCRLLAEILESEGRCA